jgi:hypothetical protein
MLRLWPEGGDDMPNKLGLLASAAAAFLTGAAAVLVFHQPTLALLHAAG